MHFLSRLIRFLTFVAFPIASFGCLGLVIASVLGIPLPASFDVRVLATLAALFFGVFSFFYRSYEAEAQSRKQHTIKILFDSRMSPEFREHLERRKHHFPEGERVDPEKYNAYLTASRDRELTSKAATERRKSAEGLRSLLNYYEFLALGIERHDLDEGMMKGSIRGMMCNLVADAYDVISGLQADNPRAYEHLTALYDRWTDPDYPRFSAK